MSGDIDSVVQGSVRPSLALTWADSDNAPTDLTGATLSGTIRAYDGTVRNVAGDLVITNAPDGAFRWDLAAADVANAGDFYVQFEANFSVGATPARSVPATWRVIASQMNISGG